MLSFTSFYDLLKLPHMLPSEEAFAAAVSALGIDNKDGVVVYDGKGIFSAARVWWLEIKRKLAQRSERVKSVDLHPNEPWILASFYSWTVCIWNYQTQILKNFLVWIKEELGPWGPLVLAIAYIPLTVFAVPASVLTVGGGYLFGLPIGFVADSIGATLGATAAFLVGKTIGRSYVISKLKKYPKFQAIAIAIQRSGFKIVLLLRFVPLLPFNVLNYLLSVTPVRLWEYMLATWLGMMPITFVFVYVGTTLKDIADVTHGWHEISKIRWMFVVFGLMVSVILIVHIIRIAKASLEKALAENGEIDGLDLDSPGLPILADSSIGLHRPLISRTDTTPDDLV